MLKIHVTVGDEEDSTLHLEGDEINRLWSIPDDVESFHLALSDGTLLLVQLDGDEYFVNISREIQGRALMLKDEETLTSYEGWDSDVVNFHGESFTWAIVNLHEPNILQPEN